VQEFEEFLTLPAYPLLLSGEGVIAKQLEAPYRPGERKGMVKIKRVRTIDTVIVGWRPGKEKGTVGSLILGLYEKGKLRPIGHTSGLKAKEKRELVNTLKPLRPARRGAVTQAAGTPIATSNGTPFDPNWSSRSPTTTPAVAASATAPRSSAGETTRSRRTAPSTS